MRARRQLSALAVLALAAAPATAGAATPKRSCTAKGAETVVKNRTTRVFTTPGAPGDDTIQRLFGCMYLNGRRVLLDESSDDDFVTSQYFAKVRLNGRFVAWEREYSDISCKADCPPGYDPTTVTVVARDLKAKRAREYDGAVKGNSLVVGVKGTPAWLEDAVGGVELHAGRDVLDVGAVASLRLKGTTLSWSNGGQPRSATLDGTAAAPSAGAAIR